MVRGGGFVLGGRVVRSVLTGAGTDIAMFKSENFCNP